MGGGDAEANEELERELLEAGHKVERTYEGGPMEGRWYVRVDGELVAEGASIGRWRRRWGSGATNRLEP